MSKKTKVTSKAIQQQLSAARLNPKTDPIWSVLVNEATPEYCINHVKIMLMTQPKPDITEAIRFLAIAGALNAGTPTKTRKPRRKDTASDS